MHARSRAQFCPHAPQLCGSCPRSAQIPSQNTSFALHVRRTWHVPSAARSADAWRGDSGDDASRTPIAATAAAVGSRGAQPRRPNTAMVSEAPRTASRERVRFVCAASWDIMRHRPRRVLHVHDARAISIGCVFCPHSRLSSLGSLQAPAARGQDSPLRHELHASQRWNAALHAQSAAACRPPPCGTRPRRTGSASRAYRDPRAAP